MIVLKDKYMTTKHGQKIRHNIRTIEEYITAKKRLSVTFFTPEDIKQITAMSNDEFFIINYCKIPIKNGTLDLTQWTQKRKAKRPVKILTIEEKRELRNNKQRDYRHKQNVLKNAPILEIPETKTQYNISEIFHLFRCDKLKYDNTYGKRLITAKHEREIQNFYIPDMFYEECYFRPMLSPLYRAWLRTFKN